MMYMESHRRAEGVWKYTNLRNDVVFYDFFWDDVCSLRQSFMQTTKRQRRGATNTTKLVPTAVPMIFRADDLSIVLESISKTHEEQYFLRVIILRLEGSDKADISVLK